MIAVVAAVLLAVHPAPWRHTVITRVSGPVRATLSFDARPTGSFGDRDIRHVTLLVRRRGAVVLARKLWRAAGELDRVSLQLHDVWGGVETEALVTLRWCGNRCSYGLYVALPQSGQLLYHDFGVETGWAGHRRGGVFEFVTADSRFFCTFSACAATTMPVQVLRIDASGQRFADISRSRPDLLRRDAHRQWHLYLQEREDHVPGGLILWWYGTFVPYCADEYRLGVPAYCDRVLRPAVKKQLTAWGYR